MARQRTTPATKTAKTSRRLGAPTLKLSAQAEDLLKDANNSSAAARNAWLAFLALVTYLLVTLAGVSHKDLLLNSPVTLPIANVEIPLFSFFQYAPIMLLLVLLSLLIQHVMLARKYRRFVEAIAPYETKTEHPARELVHSYVVSQRLAGPKRNLVTRSLMRVIVFVTFALLPILTLLYFQVKFIPYHEVWVTYWHRVMVLLGLALLFALLPIIQLKPREQGVELGPQGETWHVSPLSIGLGVAVAALILRFSWWIATVPEEWLDRHLGFLPPVTSDYSSGEKLLNPLVRSAYDRLPEAKNQEDRKWLLPWLVSHRVLVVEDQDLVPDKDDGHGEVSRVLRGRNLRFARLNRSDLHRADLTEADLRGAQMWGTRLEQARLQEALLQGADFSYARVVPGTNSIFVDDLYAPHKGSANLQGANLREANLEGADMIGVQLQAANLREAILRCANMEHAKLQGADLTGAELQRAYLSSAELQGANLSLAQLQGANLSSAQLQGANLSSAQLQGADLTGPSYVEGADLRAAKLTGAEVWLARFPFDLVLRPSPGPREWASLKPTPLTPEAKAKLEQDLQVNVTNTKLLEKVMDRLDPILRPDSSNWKHEDTWKQYIAEATEPSPDELAAFLADLTCESP